MDQQQQLHALGEFKANWRPAPTYTKSPSKMLNVKQSFTQPTPLRPLFNFAAAKPALNFQTPEQVNVVMSQLAGNQVLGDRVRDHVP
jgi:hypothetical protein